MLPISQITDEKVALEIGLPEELLDFARMVNSGELSGRADVTVRLTADLDMTGTKWVPIGFGGACFSGVFDGGGHTISGVTFRKEWPGNYGLFGACVGTIENLTVTGSITCVEGDVHSAVGGIAGLVVGGHIENCKTDIIIDSNRLSLGMYAGGVVGNVQGHSTVSDCLNRGVMDANEYDFEFLTLGDIVGRWEGESVFLQSGRRDTLSGHRRTASSMTKEER